MTRRFHLTGFRLASLAMLALAALPTAASAQSKQLLLYSWANYVPPDLLKRFEAETGIKVTSDVYDSNDTMLAKLQAGGGGYDIVVRARRRNGQLIIASAQIDGVRTAVLIDTGAQGSIGNEALRRRLRRQAEQASSVMSDINGVEATGNMQRVRQLDFGRAQINNIVVTFAESPTFAALELADQPALILGMNELHLFQRVAIDFPSRRVLLDLPEGTELPATEAFSAVQL